MKKLRVYFGMFVFIILLTLSACNKNQHIFTVTYIIDNEVYETCELNEGEKALNLEVKAKENFVFTGWKLGNKDYDFSNTVSSNIELKGNYISVCKVNGHTEVVDQAIDATCKEEGLTEGRHCSVCNEVLTKQYPISKSISHSYSEATCLNPETCTVCGKVKNDKLGEHSIVEANYEKGRHCSVCNEEFSDKLLYEVVDLEYEINYDNEMLSTEEYDSFKENLVIYGVLNDGTKVKLNNEDIEVYYESVKVNESSSKYIPPVFLKYNNYVKQTNKLYYGLLTLMDIDFTSIESAGNNRLVLTDTSGTIYMKEQDLYEYIAQFGYDKFTLSDFFESKGWEYHFETTQTELGPIYSTYFTKNDYNFYIEFVNSYIEEEWIIINFDVYKTGDMD